MRNEGGWREGTEEKELLYAPVANIYAVMHLFFWLQMCLSQY